MDYAYIDVYYEPESLGLTSVGTVDWSREAWSFDLTAVWKDAEGKFYWADDSGCSCPSPFEMINRLDMLNSGTAHDVAAYLNGRLESEKESSYFPGDVVSAEVVQLISRVME